MEIAFEASRILSITAFLLDGTTCLLTNTRVAEFERYGFGRFRQLIGALEITGAAGLLAGYGWPLLGLSAAMGLTRLLLGGPATRIRIKDSVKQTLPAFVLLLLNGYLGLRRAGRSGGLA